MTAKRQSLLKKGVLKKDYSEAAKLMDPHNINQKKLENFAIESAKYATEGKMPHYIFSQNHHVSLYIIIAIVTPPPARRINRTRPANIWDIFLPGK